MTAGIVSFSFGGNTGAAINPARDFAPRLFTLICGYGPSVLFANNFYFWIPIFAPLIGSAFATYTYSLFINNYWPPQNDDEEEPNLVKNKEIEFVQLSNISE